MAASPAIKRKRDDSPPLSASASASASAMQLPIQLPIHSAPVSASASASARFTFIAPMPALLLEPEGTESSAATTTTTDPGAEAAGGSPRTHVATRFGSLALDEDEHVHKRMRSEAGAGADAEAEAEEIAGPPSPYRPSPIDPLRASLTWQDDEITVYDPNDEDDDGTGVNGIGFKPTPAIAHARALKRRQQLAEYRKREEREARARRSSRRRPRVYTRRGGGRGGGSKLVSEKTAEEVQPAAEPTLDGDDGAAAEATPRPRRVHFLETEPVTIRFLEPEVTV